MKIVHAKAELRSLIRDIRQQRKSIGFVPTMGFLHQGHLALVKRARAENEVVIVSVFVNPTQFGPNEDLDAYPRDTRRDLALLEKEHTDIAFFPTPEALYPSGYATYVQVEGPITQVLCGRSRPTHFRGVTTIVTKLFHLTQPDRAYFGQKDAQQVAVIRKMTEDLNFDLRIVVCPTVREADGLAMSSRNANLTSTQRSQAPRIAKALFEAKALIDQGERKAQPLIDYLKKHITTIDSSVIDYVSIANARTLQEIELLSGQVLIAVAVKFGATRLIDNIEVEV